MSVADPEFARQGVPTPKVGVENLLFGQIFPENCMKMKEIGPRERARPWCPPPLDPPQNVPTCWQPNASIVAFAEEEPLTCDPEHGVSEPVDEYGQTGV